MQTVPLARVRGESGRSIQGRGWQWRLSKRVAFTARTWHASRGPGNPLPGVSHGAGAGVGGGVRGELAIELADQRDAVGEAIFGAGGGERGVLRRRRAVDEEARPWKRLKHGREGW